MRKKKILISTILALILIGTVIAFSSGIVSFEDLIFGEQSSEVSQEPEISISAEAIAVSDDSAKLKSIQSFVAQYDAENLTYEEYILVEDYLNFVLKHNLSGQELSRINALVKKGTTVATIAEIYNFYLTTNEDFEIIEEIAALEEEIWGRNWIENAFNKITENKYGVITAGEAQEYLEDFESSEILYANVLCRKGVYTIQEILDMHKNGTSWNEITDSVYSSVISSEKVTGSEAERNAMFAYFNSGIFNYDDAPFEIYKFADLCARYKIDLDDTSVDAGNLEALKADVTEKIDDAFIPAVDKLKEKLSLPQEYMTTEEYSQYYEEYYNRAINSGMPQREIEMLEMRGYSLKEIAEESEKTGGDASLTMKNVRKTRGAEAK